MKKPSWLRSRRERRLASFPADVLREAHEHCFDNRDEVLASTACGCFYCGKTFPPDEIEDWAGGPPDSDEDTTALCPRCDIDSVIGDRAGFELSAAFLARMHDYWFKPNGSVLVFKRHS